MGSALPRLPVRVSSSLRDLLAQAGPVNAATRALLLLGAHAAGLDVRPLAGEVWALAGAADLAPGVQAALVELAGTLARGGVSGGVSRGVTSGVTYPAALLPAEDAGLLGELLSLEAVGIEV